MYNSERQSMQREHIKIIQLKYISDCYRLEKPIMLSKFFKFPVYRLRTIQGSLPPHEREFLPVYKNAVYNSFL